VQSQLDPSNPENHVEERGVVCGEAGLVVRALVKLQAQERMGQFAENGGRALWAQRYCYQTWSFFFQKYTKQHIKQNT